MNARTRSMSSAAAHERHRDVVDVLFDAEREMFEVAIGDGRDVERAVGIVDALHRAQRAADFDARVDVVAGDRLDAQRDRAVGEIDALADFDVGREALIRCAHARRGAGAGFGRERERRAVGEQHRARAVGERTGAHLRARADLAGSRCACRASAIERTSAMTAACSSCVPCEKFNRTTLTPARKSSRSIFGSREAGPIVATIFVRLVGTEWHVDAT